VLDKGTLVIWSGGAIIGKEEFVVRGVRASGEPGWSVLSEVYYPAGRSHRNLAALLELAADSQPTSLRVDLPDPQSGHVYAEVGAGRVTIRTTQDAHESARQYPASGRVWLVDDSVFAVHAMAPAGTPGPVLLLAPRNGTRDSANWVDRGIGPTEVNGHELSLRHIIVSGLVTQDLWYDQQGHLIKVEEPTRGLTVVRPSPR
jgi:hypothetical protein